jgi:hypothetical protein
MNLTITITAEHLQYILNLLAEQPHKEVHLLAPDLMRQGTQQIEAARAPAGESNA